jgi:hypothetical protein
LLRPQKDWRWYLKDPLSKIKRLLSISKFRISVTDKKASRDHKGVTHRILILGTKQRKPASNKLANMAFV